MRKKLQNILHKKIIIIVLITQLLVIVGGFALNTVGELSETNQQYSEYTETMRHLDEHLEQHGRNNFELNRAIARNRIRGRVRAEDYYLTPIIE